MPHVDELLGITTLASMGLFVAVSLQPLEAADVVPAASAKQSLASELAPAQAADAAVPATPDAISASLKPVAARTPGAIGKERT
jgi:hypothetical protein